MLLAVDKDGFYLGFDVLSVNTIEGTSRVIEANEHNWPIDSILVKPKLTDSGWIEGATQEEIDYRNENQGVVATETLKSSVELKLDKILAILESKTE